MRQELQRGEVVDCVSGTRLDDRAMVGLDECAEMGKRVEVPKEEDRECRCGESRVFAYGT